jgi:hypothetical protein
VNALRSNQPRGAARSKALQNLKFGDWAYGTDLCSKQMMEYPQAPKGFAKKFTHFFNT